MSGKSDKFGFEKAKGRDARNRAIREDKAQQWGAGSSSHGLKVFAPEQHELWRDRLYITPMMAMARERTAGELSKFLASAAKGGAVERSKAETLLATFDHNREKGRREKTLPRNDAYLYQTIIYLSVVLAATNPDWGAALLKAVFTDEPPQPGQAITREPGQVKISVKDGKFATLAKNYLQGIESMPPAGAKPENSVEDPEVTGTDEQLRR